MLAGEEPADHGAPVVSNQVGFVNSQGVQHPDGIAHESETGLCIIFMLNSGKGACRDPRVRQALNYAVDVGRIIDEIKGGAAKPLNGYLTPHHFGFNPETPAYPYDPEKARSLLRAAGYGGGLKLVFDIPMAMPDEASASHVDVFIVAAQPSVRTEAALLGRELRDAGLRVESDLRGGSLKSQLRRADKMNARIAMVLGESEVENGVVQLKVLEKKTQEDVPRPDAAQRARALL
mgnify:CR=1 FL=1